MQLDDLMRNNMVAQYEATLGPNPKLQLRTGPPPASCAAADTGTLLTEIALPADWLTSPANGSVTKNGAWAGVGAAAGNAAHYRLKDSGGACREHGTVTATGGGGDLTVDNTSIAVTQAVNVTSWVRTQGGA